MLYRFTDSPVPMTPKYLPSFKDLQRDIERYLVSVGKCEKQKDGMLVFRGYDDALRLMFRLYLEEGALTPLAKHFRSWNWEHSYNDFLLDLTSALKANADWPNLQLLWEKGVIRVRKKQYNDIWKIEKNDPGTIPAESAQSSKELFLSSLDDIIALAQEFGTSEDVNKYSEMAQKVREGKKV